MSLSSFARAASGSLLRTLWNRDRAAARRRGRRAGFTPAIDCLESRRALAITGPLSIGGTTVGTYLDAPTGVDNQSDFVTVSIEGTSGTVIFNGGKNVADGTDIQTIEIVDASPDFQLTFNAAIQTGNAVPYGSDGVVQLGTITTANVIRGINTVRGPLRNVAAPQEIETSAIHLYTFNDGTVSGSTVTDLVGGLDGTLFNGASVSGGQLVLADISGTGANVQYMQLPADVVPQGSTAATFELWFTASAGSGFWSRGFDFGSNDSNYIFFSPRAGGGGSRTAISQTSSAGEQLIDGPTAYNDGTQHLATVTIDDAADTMVYYIDGVEIGSVSLGATNLSGLEAINNFLGRSQFAADPGFIGSMNQFAIYDRALSAAEVAANFTAGPIAGALSPLGFTQSTAGSDTLTLEGDQTATFPVGTFVCATPLLSDTTVGAPSFGTVTSVAFDGVTNATTLVFDNTTAAGTTAGALTLAETIQPEFRLTTFVGVNFSNRTLTEGGGIFVDVVEGGDYDYQGVTIPNLGILLTDGLLAYSSIGIRRELAATVFVGYSNAASADGRMFVETATPESVIFVGPQNAPTSKNSKFQLIGGDGEFGADVVVLQNFDGVVNLGGPATGFFQFTRNVGPLAVLNADEWNYVGVAGNFGGRINTTGADIELYVEGNVTSSARINSDRDVLLGVVGSVLKGATVAGDDITLAITGNLMGSVVSGDDLAGTVGGNLSGASIAAESDISLAVAGSILNSTISADNFLRLDVTKSVSGSQFHVSEDEGMSAYIRGNVTNSRFNVNSDDEDVVDDSLTLAVDGRFTGSTVVGEENISVDVGGAVTGSQFTSTEGDVTLDVGGVLKNTRIEAGDAMSLVTTGDALGVTALAENNVTLDIGRNWSGRAQSAADNLLLDVTGSVLKGSTFMAGNDMAVDVVGNFDGAVTSQDLVFLVGGNVSKASRIVAQQVRDWGDFFNVLDPNFSIGGRFDGVVNVGVFDAVAGDSAAATIIGGGAGQSARFYVDRFGADFDQVIFNGDFRGNLRVLQDLTANLVFIGDADRITIGGRVGTYLPGNMITPLVASIIVEGRLGYLNTNSYFQATTDGDGIFYNNSLGTSSTGLLFTGSYGKVVPTLKIVPAPGPTPPQTYTAPTAPQNFSATDSDDAILVSFDAPSSDGGLPVLYYQFSTNNGGSWSRFSNPAQVPGTGISLGTFSNGTYQVLVRAVNAVGSTATSAESVTVNFTP